MWRQGGSRNLIATGANPDVFFVVVFTLWGNKLLGRNGTRGKVGRFL